MLALIFQNDIPICYVRGGKTKVVEKAKDLVRKLNSSDKFEIPSTLADLKGKGKFSFKIIKSVEELK